MRAAGDLADGFRSLLVIGRNCKATAWPRPRRALNWNIYGFPLEFSWSRG